MKTALIVSRRRRERFAIVPRAPHGWLVIRGAETLGVHAGLPGLLRHLREELAPHAKAGRLIIGAQSLL